MAPFFYFILLFQKSSNCITSFGFETFLTFRKISIIPNCLSVSSKMQTWPSGGIILFTRLTCTIAFSLLEQCLIYKLYWNIAKPFLINPSRNLLALLVSNFDVVGRSNITNTHMILYAFNLLNILFYIKYWIQKQS